MNKFKIGDRVRSTNNSHVGIVRRIGKEKGDKGSLMNNAVWSTWGRLWRGKESKLTYLFESQLVLIKSGRRKGWIPKQGEKYWYIADHMTKIDSRLFHGRWWFDIACIKSGNYFYTREEARKVFRKIKKVLGER